MLFYVFPLGITCTNFHSTLLKRVGVQQIQQIVNEVYGSRMKTTGKDDPKLTIPVQQELAICILLLMLRKGKNKEISLGKVRYCVR